MPDDDEKANLLHRRPMLHGNPAGPCHHDQRSKTVKPLGRQGAVAGTVPTVIPSRSTSTVFDPVLSYSTFLGGVSLGTGGAGGSGNGSLPKGVTTLLVDSD
jgi:hypothetical protein